MAEGGTIDTKLSEGNSEPEKPAATSTADINKMEENTPSVAVDPELKAKVKGLLEFYFGDSNLVRDGFLRKTMETDPDEYVSIEVLCTFNKLKQLTTDVAVIAQAAQETPLLTIDASRTRIKRVKPLPSTSSADVKIVYAELYPNTLTRENLEEIFSKCGQINYVSMPKNAGVPKGFAFIEYETVEMAKEAVQKLNTISNPTHSPDAPKGMRVMSKDTWFRFKDELKELKERLHDAQKVNNVAPEPGLIMFFGNVGPDVTSKDIKMEMKNFGPLAYVEYDPDTRTGHARFKHVRVAQDVCKKMLAQKFKLGGNEIVCRVITGNEEQEYWNLIHASAARKKLEAEPHNKKPFHKNYLHNKNKTYNNNDNNNNNENMENNQQSNHNRLEGEQQGQKNNNKQKRQSKEAKVKGKKIPSIAKAKPKSHVVFDDDGEGKEVVQENKRGKHNGLEDEGASKEKDGVGQVEDKVMGEGESRKRTSEEESGSESKRVKLDEEKNT